MEYDIQYIKKKFEDILETDEFMEQMFHKDDVREKSDLYKAIFCTMRK